MKNPITYGCQICSRKHKSGVIHVDVVCSKTLLGRVIRHDGQPGREVVVDRRDITEIQLVLPLVPARHV